MAVSAADSWMPAGEDIRRYTFFKRETQVTAALHFAGGPMTEMGRNVLYESEHTTAVCYRSHGIAPHISVLTTCRPPLFSPKARPGRGAPCTGRRFVN